MNDEFRISSITDSIEKISKTLKEGDIYVNSSGRRFEIEKLGDQSVCLIELNDVNEKVGTRNWNRFTFAHAIRNRLFDKAINRSNKSAILVRRLRINELMR